jgi:predicted nucleotidyltransferase
MINKQEKIIMFEHRVSKGSRFNQIYIPLSMNEYIKAGDLVEVRVVERINKVFYSKNIGGLSDFKNKLIEKILEHISFSKQIEQVFIFGSFLTDKEDYRDIDILLVTKNQNKIEERIYADITKKFEMKFHVISINEEKFSELLKICPLTRNMLYFYASNKNFKMPKERIIDKKHINFLLMMPQDLLSLNIKSGRIFYDNLRKLIVIEGFLADKDINPLESNKQLKDILRENLYLRLRNNEHIENEEIKKIKIIIKEKLRIIKIKLNCIKN